MRQQCTDFCSFCGKPYVKKVWNATTCSRKCSVLKYCQSDKHKIVSKRAYNRQKLRGTAYYMTETGKIGNLRRSKTYRLLHSKELTEYKRKKAKEKRDRNKLLYGWSINPAISKKNRAALRLNLRLTRQSIKGSLASCGNGGVNITQEDIQMLETDIMMLRQRKARYERILGGKNETTKNRIHNNSNT